MLFTLSCLIVRGGGGGGACGGGEEVCVYVCVCVCVGGVKLNAPGVKLSRFLKMRV